MILSSRKPQTLFEAEIVSSLARVRNGLTTRPAQYLRSFVTSENIANISSFAIMAAANRVEARGYHPRRKAAVSAADGAEAGRPIGSRASPR